MKLSTQMDQTLKLVLESEYTKGEEQLSEGLDNYVFQVEVTGLKN